MFKKSYLEQLREHFDKEGIEFSIEPDRKSISSGRYYVKHISYGNTIRNYGDTIEKAAAEALSWINLYYGKHVKQSLTPHEDALRAYCKERGYSVFIEHYGPSSVSPEVTWYLRAVDEKGIDIIKTFERPIRSGEEAFSALLDGIKEKERAKEQAKTKEELEEFCRENDISLSIAGDIIGISCLITLGDSEARYYKQGPVEVLKTLQYLKSMGGWCWAIRGNYYERKVRELCSRKNWTIKNQKHDHAKDLWLIDICELAEHGIHSNKRGEEGFKEVWDNIQKLKELLS